MIKSCASMLAAVVLCVVLGWAISAYVTADAITGNAAGMRLGFFERVATYDVPGEVAEIVASTPDGKLLIYTDSASEEIGFVNIADPRRPTSGGSLAMPGEPTSVAVTPDGMWALTVVHGSSQDTLERFAYYCKG